MRRHELVSENIYHIYNRGVEKRILFMDDQDYLRFVDDLIIFNDVKFTINPKRRIRDIRNNDYKRKPLVDILTFCLMPNHYHLLLRQRVDGGITEFMRKLGDGYVKYFNLKHQRVGPLFQGKFKSVLIDDESQFIYIPFYIHLNPLDLYCSDWQSKGVDKPKKAIEFLNNFKWSSHSDYIGKSDFSLVLQRDFLKEYLGGTPKYVKDFSNFISDFDFSAADNNLILEQ
ncbi:MAG: transposase [Candidatus Azambacteria bacterium]|nr:transposase [Candidatus Azambacteria bacterium]